MKKRNFFIWMMLPVCISGISSITFAQPAPWVVPDKYVKMPNPVKADAKSIAAGKALYQVNCESCHGKKGIGNGTKAPDLKTPPGNFTKGVFQSQTDGAIFYKLTEGRKEMPKAKKDLPNDIDRWNLVNYVRTFAAPKN
ncbi:MAG TPA: cytochrome c [Chitinophagaceae bacterium]|nr:cytochrome c [Chitinophagaceae bacterium]